MNRLATRLRAVRLRATLWALLLSLLVGILALLVWLSQQYEVGQYQARLERDVAALGGELRVQLNRKVQMLQALQATPPPQGRLALDAALRQQREIVRLEWRDEHMGLQDRHDNPMRPPLLFDEARRLPSADVLAACTNARRLSGASYSQAYFQPSTDGLGMQLMELCIPLQRDGLPNGFLVATYALQDLLDNLTSASGASGLDLAFVDSDGARLAMVRAPRKGTHNFSAVQLLDLSGTTLVLRGDSWRRTPDLFPNVLSALVAGMTFALLGVLLALGHDMRRRLRAEHDLAEALAFRKAMEDSLVTGLRARDLRGRVTYVNPAFCRMVGFGADEILRNDDPVPYWPPELVTDYRRVQTTRLAGATPPRTGFESVFMRKDGSRFPVLIIEAPLIDAQQQQTGWMSAILDISDQRRVEEIQRTSQERVQASARLATMGELASLLSHELNQPLSAIAGYASGSRNLLEHPLTADTQRQLGVAVDRIAQQAERAGKVIRSVHHFVRRRDQTHEVVLVTDLLDSVMPLINLQARNMAISVQSELESPDLRADCDRTMIEQVLLNLARNGMQAMEHTHDVARILRLRVRSVGGGEHAHWLEFAVADFGSGIDADTETQLFRPFFTTKAEGLGLGLSLCRTVVEQHGGALVFEPQVPHGTVFRFTIPAVVDHFPADAANVP